jgi:hypothetical protein
MKPPRIGRCGSCGRDGLLVFEEVWPDGPEDGMVVYVCHDCGAGIGDDDE